MFTVRTIRPLRAEARIAFRKGALVVFLGVALLTGLFSAVMQDAAHEQLRNARYQVDERPWKELPCSSSADACEAERGRERRESAAFLEEQERVGERIGTLQTSLGAVRYGSIFMGLGGGLVAIVLLATLVVAGEWARGTMTHSFTSASPAAIALRKFAMVFLLALVALGFAILGAWIAGRWGVSERPLPSTRDMSLARPLAGAIAVMAVYSAVATWFAWRVREPLRTFFYAAGFLGALALTTPLGAASPGASIASALAMNQVLELEIGYLWIWPELTFAQGMASPVRIVSQPSWVIGLSVVGAFALIALRALWTQAKRLDAAQ